MISYYKLQTDVLNSLFYVVVFKVMSNFSEGLYHLLLVLQS